MKPAPMRERLELAEKEIAILRSALIRLVRGGYVDLAQNQRASARDLGAADFLYQQRTGEEPNDG